MADQPAPKPPAPPAKKAPPKKKLPLILAIVGVLVVGGGAGAFFLLRGHGGDKKEGAEKKEKAGLIALDAFTVNLADPSGDRYMKVTLRLTVTPEEMVKKVEEDPLVVAKMRDRILTVLTAKTSQEVGTSLGKESLRREIQARLNPLMEGGKVEDVLFSDLVVQ